MGLFVMAMGKQKMHIGGADTISNINTKTR